MIQVTNLPKSINEEILFEHFRRFGKILEIKFINPLSAIIEYADQVSARQVLGDPQHLIMNEQIGVSLYNELQNEQWKTVHLFVTNISADIKEHQLRTFFEQFGTVVSCKIKKIQQCKQSISGFIEFQRYEDTQYLMDIYSKQTLKINGNILIIQPYKEKSQPKPQTQIIIHSFCRKLTLVENNIPQIQRLIEFAWETLILDYFNQKNIKLRGCYIRLKKLSDSPFAIIIFDTLNETIKFMRNAEYYKSHQCFQRSTDLLKEIFNRGQKHLNIDTTLQQFIQYQHHQNDYFSGSFSQFTCHYHYNTADIFDDRVLIIENLRQEISSQQIYEFFQQYGIIRTAIIKEAQVQQGSKSKICFALALTSFDSNNIINEFLIKRPNIELVKSICNGGNINIKQLHHQSLDYEKIHQELCQLYFTATVKSNTPVPIISESMKKEHFTKFEQIIEQFDQFSFLSQLDQKYVIQQLVFQEITQHSIMNLVNQKRMACIITTKYSHLQEILQLYQKKEQFELEIEEAEDIVIMDLHQDLLNTFNSYEKIMDNFQQFYHQKDDQKIFVIKFLITSLIIKIPKNQASKLAKRLIKHFNSNLQDLLILLEDKNELQQAITSLDQEISEIKQ